MKKRILKTLKNIVLKYPDGMSVEETLYLYICRLVVIAVGCTIALELIVGVVIHL